MFTSYVRRIVAPENSHNDWSNLRCITPYIWQYRGRVVLALVSLVFAKLAVIGVPLVLKEIVDRLDASDTQLVVVPIALLLGYGGLRALTSLFNELRDIIFARVRYRAMRQLSTQVLHHLHELSLRFHLTRETGAIFRDLERGTQSIATILNYMVFHILPVIVEFVLVAIYLFSLYEPWFGGVVFTTVGMYIVFTVLLTNWRMQFRYKMNELDSQANGLAVDSVINYETVKYFNKEAFECSRYAGLLKDWEQFAVQSQTTMSLLNFGQGLIIAIGVSIVMLFAAHGVLDNNLSLGDLILINTMMLQLFMPLSTLGIVYRAVRYALADMDMILKLLGREQEIKDSVGAIAVSENAKTKDIVFNNISFAYYPQRTILKDVSFVVPAGAKVAIVGPSGSGKSTLVRLLFRFYDVTSGHILVGGRDVRDYKQQSLRSVIGIVPQDTVLFNRSLYTNIAYGSPHKVGREDVVEISRQVGLHDFITALPQGYDTVVGERGLKLSGGERQKIAIARALLKKPMILVFDEATSNLDTHSEKVILKLLDEIALGITTLVIAHRLSTVVSADKILVMSKACIVERGTHQALLDQGGLYASLWQTQQKYKSDVGIPLELKEPADSDIR
ncbi:MAG: ABC transporter ATP-binding protein/permease [Chromatiales bacterium]|nr:ABC transporter ATP-binding protein/permease [Chromatiales bacterium]